MENQVSDTVVTQGNISLPSENKVIANHSNWLQLTQKPKYATCTFQHVRSPVIYMGYADLS